MGDLLQVGKMAVQQCGSDGEEVRVARVVNLHNTPWVLTGPNRAATDLNSILRTDNSEWHEASKLGILLDGVLIVLFDVVGEVVHRDTVVLDVLHDQLLRFGQLTGGQGVRATDDGDDVDTRRQTLHQLDVQLTETNRLSVDAHKVDSQAGRDVPMAGRRDKVEQRVNSVVSEARVTLDTRLLGQNVVVLSLEVTNNFRETASRHR